jgi:hypothetical protein
MRHCGRIRLGERVLHQSVICLPISKNGWRHYVWISRSADILPCGPSANIKIDKYLFRTCFRFPEYQGNLNIAWLHFQHAFNSLFLTRRQDLVFQPAFRHSQRPPRQNGQGTLVGPFTDLCNAHVALWHFPFLRGGFNAIVWICAECQSCMNRRLLIPPADPSCRQSRRDRQNAKMIPTQQSARGVRAMRAVHRPKRQSFLFASFVSQMAD